MRYTTRVELHKATDDDYEELHSAMENEGFSRFIESDDSIRYHLPTAEYNYDGSASLDQVLDKATRAANSTGRSHMVLVTKSDGRKWHGLPKAS
jgi:hypothetical protein